jgi:hypothetical protein
MITCVHDPVDGRGASHVPPTTKCQISSKHCTRPSPPRPVYIALLMTYTFFSSHRENSRAYMHDLVGGWGGLMRQPGHYYIWFGIFWVLRGPWGVYPDYEQYQKPKNTKIAITVQNSATGVMLNFTVFTSSEINGYSKFYVYFLSHLYKYTHT